MLDGWGVAGHIEGVTGLVFGQALDPGSEGLAPRADADARHAAALHDKLATSVLLCFYRDRDRFAQIMRHAVALNGAFSNTQRMVRQYLRNAYRV